MDTNQETTVSKSAFHIIFFLKKISDYCEKLNDLHKFQSPKFLAASRNKFEDYFVRAKVRPVILIFSSTRISDYKLIKTL